MLVNISQGIKIFFLLYDKPFSGCPISYAKFSFPISSQEKVWEFEKNASNQGKVREFDWPKRESGQSVIFCLISKQHIHWMIGYGGFLV